MKDQFRLAGWVSITNAIFTIPAMILSYSLGSREGAEVRIAQGILLLVSLGLFLYILLSLKRLLNLRFRFHDVDIYISYLIWGNVSLSLFHFLSLASKEFEWAVSILSVGAYIFFGILSILFATRLLRLQSNLYGLLKPFSYLSIASGACFVSIILLPLGILTGAVTDFLLGIIFFRAGEQPSSPDELFRTPLE